MSGIRLLCALALFALLSTSIAPAALAQPVEQWGNCSRGARHCGPATGPAGGGHGTASGGAAAAPAGRRWDADTGAATPTQAGGAITAQGAGPAAGAQAAGAV